MSYKFNPCVPCPCESTTTCTKTLFGDVAVHLNISVGMTAFVLSVVSPVGCFVPTGSYLLVSAGGLNYRRIGAPLLNIAMELDGITTTPNPAFGYELLRRIKTLTFTSGADVLAYKFDADASRLIRDDNLTTAGECCLDTVGFRTWFTSRIFNTVPIGGTAQPKTVRISLAGFGGVAPCPSFNGTTPYANQFPAASTIAESYWTPAGNGITNQAWQRALLPPGTINDLFRLITMPVTTNRWATHFDQGATLFPNWHDNVNPVMAAAFRQGTPIKRASYILLGSAAANMTNPYDSSLFVYDPVSVGAFNCGPVGTLTAIDEL